MNGGNALALALRCVARGGRLTRDEARAAFDAILEDGASPAQTAGLLVALASRGETAEEVAGVVEALHARAATLPATLTSRRAVDVCGTGGDGLGTFNISTASAFVVAGAGVPVAKHGNRAVSSSCGSADVLAALGVEIEMSPERAARALERANVTFLFAPLYHGVMKKVAPLRKELGVRTIFNLAGPLANPARVKRQIVGVDRPQRVEVLAGALLSLGTERALVFSNEAGGDELLPVGSTRVAEVRGGAVRTFTVSARDFELDEGSTHELRGGDANANAQILRRILHGERGVRRDTVLMNAAAALFVAEAAADLTSALDLAARAIDEGRAAGAFAMLSAVSRGEEAA